MSSNIPNAIIFPQHSLLYHCYHLPCKLRSKMHINYLKMNSYLICFLAFQVIFDSGSRGYWLNELFLLLHSDVDTCLRLQCADTLFAALDNCRDIVQVSHSGWLILRRHFFYGKMHVPTKIQRYLENL